MSYLRVSRNRRGGLTGETDAARLSDAYPSCDIAVLPAGADSRPHTAAYASQLLGYELVLLGHDDDEAGNAGALQLADQLPQAQRFKPPANDWCDTEDFPEIPVAAPQVAKQILVSAHDLLTLEAPHIISWLDHAVLPVAGQMIIHGWAKSYKSFLALDLLASLAQGEPWAGIEATEEPCRVALAQYEIVWAFYQQRVRMLREQASRPKLFDANFFTFTPLQRPTFVAGNLAEEDKILSALVDNDIQVFLLDPVRRATGLADLNSEREVRPLLNFFARLQDNGITVVSTHHDNKTYSRAGGGNPLGMTGVGAFAGDADTIVSVGIPKGSDVDSPLRNLHFTLRNAQAISAKGLQMTEIGQLVYSNEPHGDHKEEAI